MQDAPTFKQLELIGIQIVGMDWCSINAMKREQDCTGTPESVPSPVGFQLHTRIFHKYIPQSSSNTTRMTAAMIRQQADEFSALVEGNCTIQVPGIPILDYDDNSLLHQD